MPLQQTGALPYMNLHLNSLVYGNPSIQDWRNMQVKGYLDDILPELKTRKPFLNYSPNTRKELAELIELATKEQSPRKELLDGALIPHMRQICIEHGVEETAIRELTENIVSDVLPIITKLKYFFNRPRPFQLAYYMGIAFYPQYSLYVSSPSYPSGHCTLAIVTGYVIGLKYPAVNPLMKSLINEVADSRLQLGVHFPSDNAMAMETSRFICEHPGFVDKYQVS